MKHFLSAVFLVVFGLAVSASAGGFKMSPAELKALKQQLTVARLQKEPLTDNDFDDNFDPSTRGWNPISWIKDKLKNKCLCENGECDCCFKLKLFNSKACISAKAIPSEQKLQINLKLNDKSMVEKSFNLKRVDSVCGPVPVPALSFLKFCFNQKSQVEANGAISSCSNVEFKVDDVVGAVLQLKCMELKGGKLTFGGNKELQKSGMFSIEAKSPFKAALKLYQKATG